MADFSVLTAQVNETVGVAESAIALLNGIQARIDTAIAADNLSDDSNVAQLSAQLKAETDSLAAAVASNTPPA